MTKESIIERLIDQGHIVMSCAGRILNKKDEYIQDIEDLHRDGNINTRESMRLLTEPGSFYFNPAVKKDLTERIQKESTHFKQWDSIETPNETTQTISSEPWASMGETCRNGKLWRNCTCC